MRRVWSEETIAQLRGDREGFALGGSGLWLV